MGTTANREWKDMRKGQLEDKIYDNRFGPDVVFRQKMWQVLTKDFFQKYIHQTSSVLDLATGFGEFINSINAREKYACDINPASKKYLANNVVFYRAVSTKIPIKDNTLDAIFISNFFEHITREEIIGTIKECYRILKKRGKVLILQPNIRFCGKDYWMFFDHITPIDDRALVEIFSIYKLSLVKKIEKFLPYSTKNNMPKNFFLIKLYLHAPFLWNIFGKQSFLLFEK